MNEGRIKEWLEMHEPTVDDTMQLLAEAREEAYRAGYEEAAGVPEELENCLYEWLKEQK